MTNSLALIPSAIGAAAIMPALSLLWLIVSVDRRPEHPGWIAVAFLGGAGTIFVLHVLPSAAPEITRLTANPWLSAVLRALFVAAIPEEVFKVLVIVLVALGSKAFREPVNAVVYGAAVGLGFAAYENLGYLFRHADQWETLAVMRNLLTVPLHGALGVIAGIYVSRAWFGTTLGQRRPPPVQRMYAMIVAVLVPIGLHALFDAPLLALRSGSIVEPWQQALLEAGGLVIGIAIIAMTAQLAWRVSGRQYVAVRDRGAASGRFTHVWALIIGGSAAGFAGTVLLISGLMRARAGHDEAILVSIGIAAILIGVGFASYVAGSRRLCDSARQAGKQRAI
jgi:RsiW-degrading membrane proteinase PrsW (M82 family)